MGEDEVSPTEATMMAQIKWLWPQRNQSLYMRDWLTDCVGTLRTMRNWC